MVFQPPGSGGLVVQSVEGVLGQQVQLEALAVATDFEQAMDRTCLPAGAWCAADRSKAAIPFQRDGSFEDGMPVRVMAQAAARDAAHHAIVYGRPVCDSGRVGEVEEQ